MTPYDIIIKKDISVDDVLTLLEELSIGLKINLHPIITAIDPNADDEEPIKLFYTWGQNKYVLRCKLNTLDSMEFNVVIVDTTVDDAQYISIELDKKNKDDDLFFVQKGGNNDSSGFYEKIENILQKIK